MSLNYTIVDIQGAGAEASWEWFSTFVSCPTTGEQYSTLPSVTVAHQRNDTQYGVGICLT